MVAKRVLCLVYRIPVKDATEKGNILARFLAARSIGKNENGIDGFEVSERFRLFFSLPRSKDYKSLKVYWDFVR